MKDLQEGDYVLASKWDDGDPKDHWAVGFYVGMTWHGRYKIADSEGNLFRGNGFRRAAKIAPKRGHWILENKESIEKGWRSVWWWKRAKMSEGT